MATTLDQPPTEMPRSAQVQVAATSFMSLFAIVGLALYGLPFFYDFMVRDFGWTRAQVTSGNAISKLLVGPLFMRSVVWGQPLSPRAAEATADVILATFGREA